MSDEPEITRTIGLPLTAQAEIALAQLSAHFQRKHQTLEIKETDVICSALIGMAQIVDPQPQPGDVADMEQVRVQQGALN